MPTGKKGSPRRVRARLKLTTRKSAHAQNQPFLTSLARALLEKDEKKVTKIIELGLSILPNIKRGYVEK